MTNEKRPRTVSLRIAILLTALPIAALVAAVGVQEYLRQPPIVVTRETNDSAAILTALGDVKKVVATKDAGKTECHVKLDAEKAPAPSDITLEKQYETAIHEAGHALLGRLLTPEEGVKNFFLYVAEPAKAGYLGRTYFGDGTVADTSDGNRRSAMRLYGGQAAEELILGNKPPDDYSDKDVAGERLLGYCEKTGCPCPPKARVGSQCRLDVVLRVQRERFYPETMRCLAANKEALVALANALFRKSTVAVPEGNENAHGTTDAKWRILGTFEIDSFFETHPLVDCPAR